MLHDEEGIHFSREDLLNDLELLQRFYDIYGKKKIINWIVRGKKENPECNIK
jgi:hypothetical protein